MKRKILIGCGMVILLALVWVGARNMSATAETDVSSEEDTKQDASDTDVKKEDSLKTAKKNSKDADGETEEDISEDKDAENDLSEDTEEDSGNDPAETVSRIAESMTSDEGLLYRIETSSGSNLGMVPIVNGNAVVLMDGTYASIYQGDYVPEELSALTLKLEEKTAQAASTGIIDAWAFYRESQLRSFEFPEGVTAIEKFAFARSGLNSVAVPEGVTSIGSGAFYHCDALTDVTIPDSVTTIEENAFSHTPWLENWMAGGEGEENGPEEETGQEETAAQEENPETSYLEDFLIVGDGILLAYRGSEEDPELPTEVKSVVSGALGE